MSQLARLAKPFPAKLIKDAPQGKFGTYAEHSTYNQALLAIVGPFSYRLVQTVRGESGMIEGVVGELTVTIDNKEVTVQEAGDCEHPGTKKTQGDRLKDASSDAFKRCCMRIGLGLHLWAQTDYILYDLLVKRSQEDRDDSQDRSGSEEPDDEGAGHEDRPQSVDP